ncbi:MAG TPA: STAS domain-containing protein [Burkholderiaceae bacterium]
MSAVGTPTPLPSTLTLRDAESALAALRTAFAANGGEVWQIDAAPVAQVDTSALAVLLECARMAEGAKRRLEILGVPQRLADLAHLYGVDVLLGFPARPNGAGLAAAAGRMPAGGAHSGAA